MLRFYIEFSAPMGRAAALPPIRLVDDTGQDVVDPFLPVEAEFWSPDRTRFTPRPRQATMVSGAGPSPLLMRGRKVRGFGGAVAIATAAGTDVRVPRT